MGYQQYDQLRRDVSDEFRRVDREFTGDAGGRGLVERHEHMPVVPRS
jgi:hypothetical protein